MSNQFLDTLCPMGCSDACEEVEDNFICHCHDMFYSYDTANPDYVPNNTCPPPRHICPPSPHIVNAPTTLRNKKGDFIGFSWLQGQSVTIEFGFNPEFTFIYPDGTYGTFYDYLLDKQIDVILYNFRMEPVNINTIEAGTEIIRLFMDIDAKLSDKLYKGLYYMKIIAHNDTDSLVILNPTDIVLLIK